MSTMTGDDIIDVTPPKRVRNRRRNREQRAANNTDTPLTDEDKNLVVRFCLTASRKAKRAVLYTGKTIGEGVKVVGRGIAACLPYIGYILAVAATTAVILGLGYLNLLFIQFAFTVSPIIGWLLVTLTAIQLVGVVAGGAVTLWNKVAG